MSLPSTKRRAMNSRGSARVLAAAVVLLAGFHVPVPATAKTQERPPEITYDAASMEADYKTHMMRLKDVTITYGKMTVRADRALATASDFKNSRWTFAGNVRINAEQSGNLRSDQAIVEFEDNQLKRATATGNPAEFDQKREDSNVIARGHANQIVYEVGPGTVRLSDDAWVTDGHSGDIRGPVIVYNLREEHVEATTSPGTDRVHVTIIPNEGPKVDGAGSNKPKPTPPPDPAKPQASAPPQDPAPNPPPVAAQQSTPH